MFLPELGGNNQVPSTRVMRTKNTVQRHDEPACTAECTPLFLFADSPPSHTPSIPPAPRQSTAWQDLPSPGLAPSDLPPRECHREVCTGPSHCTRDNRVGGGIVFVSSDHTSFCPLAGGLRPPKRSNFSFEDLRFFLFTRRAAAEPSRLRMKTNRRKRGQASFPRCHKNSTYCTPRRTPPSLSLAYNDGGSARIEAYPFLKRKDFASYGAMALMGDLSSTSPDHGCLSVQPSPPFGVTELRNTKRASCAF